MNTGKRSIDLSLVPNKVNPRMYVSMYDVGVTLTFNWTGVLATGARAVVMGTKPSGIGFTEECTINRETISGTSTVTSFTVETTLDMTSEAGEFPAEIRITEGTQVVGSQNFTLVVERSPHPDGTIDGYEEGRTIIETVTGLVNDAEESASEAATSATAAASSATAAAQSATSAADDAASADASAARAMATTPEGYEEFVTELLANQNGGYVRKNLLQNKMASGTQNGITFTVNDDGSILANGTNSGNAFARYITARSSTKNWSGQSLILSGCPAGGSKSTYSLRVYEGDEGRSHDTGSGSAFTGASNIDIGIYIAAGATLNNVTFYPMVRPATIEDSTYVPYAPSNSALNADLANSFETLTSEYINGGARLMRFGKLRILYLWTPKNLPKNTFTTIFTLASSDRPNVDISVDTVAPQTTNTLRVRVQTGGNVQIYNYGAAETGNINAQALIFWVVP